MLLLSRRCHNQKNKTKKKKEIKRQYIIKTDKKNDAKKNNHQLNVRVSGEKELRKVREKENSGFQRGRKMNQRRARLVKKVRKRGTTFKEKKRRSLNDRDK